MKTYKLPLLLSLALLSTVLAATAAADPALGDQVVYRSATSEYRTAVVTAVVSGTTIDLVALSDGDDYGDGNSGSVPAAIYRNVVLGTDVGQYAIGTSVFDLITGFGFLRAPSGVSSSGLTLGGSGVQLSGARAVLLTVRLTAAMASTASVGQDYIVELRCDSGSTPAAVVDDESGSLSGVTASATQPVKLVAIVHPGDFCRVVQSAGAATLTLTGARAQEL